MKFHVNVSAVLQLKLKLIMIYLRILMVALNIIELSKIGVSRSLKSVRRDDCEKSEIAKSERVQRRIIY